MPPAIAHAIGELYIGASEIAQGRAGIARDMAPPHEFSDAFATMVAFEIGNEVDKRAARSDRRQLPRIAHQITRPDRPVERHSALSECRAVAFRWPPVAFQGYTSGGTPPGGQPRASVGYSRPPKLPQEPNRSRATRENAGRTHMTGDRARWNSRSTGSFISA